MAENQVDKTREYKKQQMTANTSRLPGPRIPRTPDYNASGPLEVPITQALKAFQGLIMALTSHASTA